jgi:hypothetical protein
MYATADEQLLSDLVRRIRNVRARYSRLDPIALAAKEADLTNAWLDRLPNLRDRFKTA